MQSDAKSNSKNVFQCRFYRLNFDENQKNDIEIANFSNEQQFLKN